MLSWCKAYRTCLNSDAGSAMLRPVGWIRELPVEARLAVTSLYMSTSAKSDLEANSRCVHGYIK